MATSARLSLVVAALLCLAFGAAWAASSTEDLPRIDAVVQAEWTPIACDIETVLTSSRKTYDEIKGYFSYVVRRHRVDDEELMAPQTSKLWYKKPLAARMTVTAGPRAGTDILYVKGKNEGKIRARGVGLLSFKAMNLKVESGLAMKGELHPFTSVGIETTLTLVEEQYALLKKRVPDLKVGAWKAVQDGRELRRYELVMPVNETDEDGKDVYFCDRAEVVFDLKLNLPTEVRVYEDGRLREEYVYFKMEINPTFGANVFDFDDI